MAKSLKSYIYYGIIIIIFSEYCVSDDYKCDQNKENECLCEFNKKQYLDISNIQSNFSSGNITYFFNGCKNHANITGCQNSKLCSYDIVTKNGTNLGDKIDFIPLIGEHGAYNIELLDINKKPTNNSITLVCTRDFNQTVFMNKQGLKNNFYIFSSNVCLITLRDPGGLSTGSTLLILFLIGGLVYFVGGAVVLHCVRGARGKEMIPNIDFWQDLPDLVRDGLVYILNGCRPTAIATAECYDRI